MLILLLIFIKKIFIYAHTAHSTHFSLYLDKINYIIHYFISFYVATRAIFFDDIIIKIILTKNIETV
jgi:hypothetical protein